MFLIDEVDSGRSGRVVDAGADDRVILEVDERAIAMDWCQKIIRQKVGAEDGLFDVRNNEVERVGTST